MRNLLQFQNRFGGAHLKTVADAYWLEEFLESQNYGKVRLKLHHFGIIKALARILLLD